MGLKTENSLTKFNQKPSKNNRNSTEFYMAHGSTIKNIEDVKYFFPSLQSSKHE
jgi:hypothetical protein